MVVYFARYANSGYWQIEIDERVRDKNAFASYHGANGSAKMPFGLKNTPATFWRVMDFILISVC